jgi:hypothetical protein
MKGGTETSGLGIHCNENNAVAGAKSVALFLTKLLLRFHVVGRYVLTIGGPSQDWLG